MTKIRRDFLASTLALVATTLPMINPILLVALADKVQRKVCCALSR